MQIQEKKVTPLLEALTVVLAALENDSIEYDPECKTQCNCGLLAQAITETNSDQLYETYLYDLNNKYLEKYGTYPSWTGLVSEYCPLTGEPSNELFKKLYEAGLSREDISSLEYLADPKIVESAKIIAEPRTITMSMEKKVGWWIFSRRVVTLQSQQVEHYHIRENLILYLRAWVDLLKNGECSSKMKYKTISVNGETYRYRNRMELEGLKDFFLNNELYEGVTLAQKELNKY